MGTWLHRRRRALRHRRRPAQRHAILLTDGRTRRDAARPAAGDRRRRRAVFQCDCRGVGADWEVNELRGIASALLGTVDLIAEPERHGRRLRADDAQRRWAAGSPTRRCGSGRRRARRCCSSARSRRRSRTSRPRGRRSRTLIGDYPDRRPGATSRATTTSPCGCRRRRSARSSWPRGCSSSSATRWSARAWCKATWSDDATLTTRINPAVAHYTGQAELAAAIQEGLAAKAAGDDATATVKLGRAAQLAARDRQRGGDDEAREGRRDRGRRDRHGAPEARRRQARRDGARHALDQDDPGASRERSCPNGHQSATDDFCDICGAPIAPAARRRRPRLRPPPTPSPAPRRRRRATQGVPELRRARTPPTRCSARVRLRLHDGSAPATAPPASVSSPPHGPAPPRPAGRGRVGCRALDRSRLVRGARRPPASVRPVARRPSSRCRGTEATIGRVRRSGGHADIDCSGERPVSHRHAKLTLDHDRWYVEDLGSTNGTFVGSPTLMPPTALAAGERHELADSERIYIGAWTRIVIRRATPEEQGRGLALDLIATAHGFVGPPAGAAIRARTRRRWPRAVVRS